MLKGTYYGLYKKISEKTGLRITVFKYAVSGTEQELTNYKDALAAQGQPCHLEEDDATHKGKMIYFTTTHGGSSVNLSISKNNAIFVSDDNAAILESRLQTVSDPALKAAMANRIADMLLGAPAPAAAQPAAEIVADAPAAEPADLQE